MGDDALVSGNHGEAGVDEEEEQKQESGGGGGGGGGGGAGGLFSVLSQASQVGSGTGSRFLSSLTAVGGGGSGGPTAAALQAELDELRAQRREEQVVLDGLREQNNQLKEVVRAAEAKSHTLEARMVDLQQQAAAAASSSPPTSDLAVPNLSQAIEDALMAERQRLEESHQTAMKDLVAFHGEEQQRLASQLATERQLRLADEEKLTKMAELQHHLEALEGELHSTAGALSDCQSQLTLAAQEGDRQLFELSKRHKDELKGRDDALATLRARFEELSSTSVIPAPEETRHGMEELTHVKSELTEARTLIDHQQEKMTQAQTAMMKQTAEMAPIRQQLEWLQRERLSWQQQAEELQQAQVTVSQLQMTLQEERRARQEAAEASIGFQQELESVRASISSVKVDRSRLEQESADLEVSAGRISELIQQVEELRHVQQGAGGGEEEDSSEKVRLTQELEEANSQRLILEEEARGLRDSILALEAEQLRLREAGEEERGRLTTELEETNLLLQEQTTHQSSAASALLAEKAKLSQELEYATSQVAALQREAQTMLDSISALKAEQLRLKQAAEEERLRLTMELEEAHLRIQEQATMSDHEASSAILSTEKAKLTQELEQATSRVSILQQEAQTMRDSISVLEAEQLRLSQTEARTLHLTVELERTNLRLQEHTTQLTSLKPRLQAVELELHQVTSQRDQALQQCQTLETTLEEAHRQLVDHQATSEAQHTELLTRAQQADSLISDLQHQIAQANNFTPSPTPTDSETLATALKEATDTKAKLTRLKTHLLEQEELHSQETLRLEEEVASLTSQLSSLSSQPQTSQELEDLQAVHQATLDELATLRATAEEAQDTVSNLQLALDGFQGGQEAYVRERLREVTDELTQAQAQASTAEKQAETLREAAEKYEEAMVAIAQFRLALAEKDRQMGVLRHEKEQTAAHLKESMEKLQSATEKDENIVDRRLVNSLLVKYLQKPERRAETLPLLGKILQFTPEERALVEKGGVEEVGSSGWGGLGALVSWAKPEPERQWVPPLEGKEATSFTDMWVNFLEHSADEPA